MIAKANTHNSGSRLATYLTRKRDGQTAEVWQLRGFEADNIKDALRDIDIIAGATRCENPLFHVQIRIQDGERLTREQWEHAATSIEQAVGFAGQPRAIVFHTYQYTGDVHMHIAFSRIDEETMTAKPVPYFKLVLKEVTRDLEQELGLIPVRKDREGPIKYAPTKAEDEQARRLGVDVNAVRNTIRACWDQSDCGNAFISALNDHDLILAKGDEAPFLVLDQAGGIHPIGQRILDKPAAYIRQKMTDIDRDHLPGIEAAREQILDVPANRLSRLERELKDTNYEIADQIQKTIMRCWAASTSGNEFADQLARYDLILARGDHEPFVVLDPVGGVHSSGILDIPAARIRQHLADLENIPTIEEAHGIPQDRDTRLDQLADSNKDIADALGRLFQTIDIRDANPDYGEKLRLEAERAQEYERTRWMERERQRQQQSIPFAPELRNADGQIRLAYSLTNTGQEFADAIEDRGFILARITEEDAERMNRWEKQRVSEIWQPPDEKKNVWMAQTGGIAHLSPDHLDQASRSYHKYLTKKAEQRDPEEQEEKRRSKPLTFDRYVSFVQEHYEPGAHKYDRYREGELVVIDQFSGVHQLTYKNTGDSFEDREKHFKGIDINPLMSVSAADASMQYFRSHQYAEWRQKRAAEKEPPKQGTRAAEIRAIYQASENGQQFEDAIERKGHIFAQVSAADANRLNRWERAQQKEEAELRGEPFDTTRPTERYKAGDLVVIDNWGNIGQLTDLSTGDSEKWREQKLTGIDRSGLMNVASSQSAMRMLRQHQRDERQNERQQAFNEQHWPINPPKPERTSPSLFGQAADEAARDRRPEDARGVSAHLWELWSRVDPGKRDEAIRRSYEIFGKLHEFSIATDQKAFVNALEDRGITFAIATKEEAAESHRLSAFAREVGNYSPRFNEGEIVIVTEQRNEYWREGEIFEPGRVHKIDQSLAEKFVRATGGRDKLHSIDATLLLSDSRAEQRRADHEATALDRAGGGKGRSVIRDIDQKLGQIGRHALGKPLRVSSYALGGIGKSIDILADGFASLFAPTLTPEQAREAEITQDRRIVEGEITQQRREDEAERTRHRSR